jgi:hypothetical protein
VAKFTDDDCKEFGKKFLGTYLSLGFGVLSKKETESLIFSIIEKTTEFKGKRNYDIANELRITEARLKTLRLEAAMRFATLNYKAHLGNIVQTFLDRDVIPALNTDKIELLLENPVEKREYENAVKVAGQHVEYGRNREIVVTTPAALLAVIVSNAEKGQEHFKSIVQANIANAKQQKEILNASLTLPQKISRLAEGLTPVAVKAIFISAKGLLGSSA